MKIIVSPDKGQLGEQAGARAAAWVNEAIARKGQANIILATGASQFEFLQALVGQEVAWEKVAAFHLDEYVGMPATHPASFRKYLQERFVAKVPVGTFHWVEGDAPNLAGEVARLGKVVAEHPIDVACIGIGENGHLAFNDPPADFETVSPYLLVDLDEQCRRQQLGEGWFATLNDVPARAISMSVRQIMKSAAIVCSVPDARKAQAVRDCFQTDEISPQHPGSILQSHGACEVFLDQDSARLLPASRLEKFR